MFDTIQSDEEVTRIKGRNLKIELKLHSNCLPLILLRQRMNEQKVLHANESLRFQKAF